MIVLIVLLAMAGVAASGIAVDRRLNRRMWRRYGVCITCKRLIEDEQ